MKNMKKVSLYTLWKLCPLQSYNGVWNEAKWWARERTKRKKREKKKLFNESFSCLKMIDDLQLVFEKMDGNISLNGSEGKKSFGEGLWDSVNWKKLKILKWSYDKVWLGEVSRLKMK